MQSMKTTEYDTAISILQYLLESGKLNLDDVAADMKKAEKCEILKKHPYPITKGRDGRYRTYVKKEDGSRKQIAKSTYEKVEDVLIDYYKGQAEAHSKKKITLEDLYPIWLDYKRIHNAAPAYIKRIESNWRNWYADADIVKQPITTLTKLSLDVWSHELIEQVRHIKKEYYNISMIMRQMLDYAVDADIISENPFRKVKIESRQVFDPVKKKPSEMQVFTREEVEALYEVAWRHFEAESMTIHKLAPLAVMFQFQTGIRIGELCAVRYEDITDSDIFIHRMYRYEEKEVVEYTKGHHEGRLVPLTSEAIRIIDTARKYQQQHSLNDSGYIFSVNEEPLSYYAIRKLYAKYCEEINTTAKSSHKSRMTYISALIDGGVNINTIRDMVGHADERTTYSSYCYDRKSKSERIDLIEKALS